MERFSNLEIETLLEVIDRFLSDLSSEISDTDSLDYRQVLKEKREVLNQVVVKLQNERAATENLRRESTEQRPDRLI
jgi:hypothetical protein